MKKAFMIFWMMFILYFILAHPAIIYYNTEFPNHDLANVSPYTALATLGLSFLLWSVILCGLFYLLYKHTFLAKKQLDYLMHHGQRLQATILTSSSKRTKGDMEQKNLLLEMTNFEHEKISHRLEVVDSKPQEHRFENGKSLYLRIDPEFKLKPFLAAEDVKARIRPSLFILWSGLLVAVCYYYYFSYSLENAGYGWRFLVWYHPLIVSPATALFFSTLFYLIFKFLIFKNLHIGKDSLMLKFMGKKTIAHIKSIHQTGTYINEQPQLKFTIEFSDERGNLHQETIKKIVPLLDIASVKEGDSESIFYNPKDPTKIAFEKDLQDTAI